MNRKCFTKAICIGVAVSVICTTSPNTALSSSLCQEKELAGMSFMLNKYYDVAIASEVTDISQVVGDAGAVETTPPQSTEVLPVVEVAQVEQTTETVATPEPVVTPEPVSIYSNVGISVAQEFVNVRKGPNTDSEILGKLYRGSAATIEEDLGEWVKIKSGKVTGYINSEFLAIGFSAENLVDTYGTKLATVNTTTLKVRDDKDANSAVLTLVPNGETFEVLKVYDEWVKILVDDTTKGFVAKEFIDLDVEFEEAVSTEDELAKLAAAEAAKQAELEAIEQLKKVQANLAEKKAAQEAAAKAAVAKAAAAKAAAEKAAEAKKESSEKTSKVSDDEEESDTKEEVDTKENTSTSSSSGSEVVNFAVKFVGNAYVYGGTSLTSGTDCSGFVQSIYRNFGVSLPRTSSSQSGTGQKISIGNAQAGDLVFYASNGHVNHVAMYMGGGRVVHASNSRTGITISNMNYRTPYCVRRVMN